LRDQLEIKMLRNVLPLGSGTDNTAETNNKLLELADRDGNEDATTNPEGTQQEETESEVDPMAIASVVTQYGVNTTDSRPGTSSHADDIDGRSSWKSKFRQVDYFKSPFIPSNPSSRRSGHNQIKNSLLFISFHRSILCCLAPSTSEQYAAQEEGPVVIRPPPFSDLPRWPVPVLGPQLPHDAGKKTLVLDLDETLVHSSFRPVPSPDYVIPVEIEGRIVDVYVLKRPFVDHFLRAVGQRFEVVVFTASLGKYADPLLDLLDRSGVVRWRLFREACYPYEGSYVKDLQCMGREMSQMILVDNSPHSYAFQPENAIPIETFIDDMQDQELLECLDLLLAVEKAPDVRPALAMAMARRDAGMPLTGVVGDGGTVDGNTGGAAGGK
jgi:RNA polymerase II subunit A small phosphatase-like protein